MMQCYRTIRLPFDLAVRIIAVQRLTLVRLFEVRPWQVAQHENDLVFKSKLRHAHSGIISLHSHDVPSLWFLAGQEPCLIVHPQISIKTHSISKCVLHSFSLP